MFQLMLYGPAGIGIHSLAEQAPDPVVIQTAEACDCSCVRYDVSKNMRLHDAIQAVIESKEFKTVVINNATGLERLIFDYEFGRKVNPYEQGYGVGDGRLKIRFRQVIDKINEAGKNLVILADAQAMNMPGVFSSQPVLSMAPNVNRCLMPLINDMFQAVIPVVLVENADGHLEKRIILSPRPSVMARVNSTFMDVSSEWMPFDASFFKAIKC